MYQVRDYYEDEVVIDNLTLKRAIDYVINQVEPLKNGRRIYRHWLDGEMRIYDVGSHTYSVEPMEQTER